MAKIRVTQVRKGKKVTFLTKDKGKPGKTPEEEQWFEPGVETGWEKGMPQGERRQLVLKAHKGDELASARAMQSLANVTTDRETKREARADATYFFSEYKSHPHGIMGRSKQLRSRRGPRITPKRPRLGR